MAFLKKGHGQPDLPMNLPKPIRQRGRWGKRIAIGGVVAGIVGLLGFAGFHAGRTIMRAAHEQDAYYQKLRKEWKTDIDFAAMDRKLRKPSGFSEMYDGKLKEYAKKHKLKTIDDIPEGERLKMFRRVDDFFRELDRQNFYKRYGRI